MNAIKTRIIKIGNSRGIRIPKLLLDQLGFDSEVEVSVEGEQLVVRPASRLRADWDEKFRSMAEHADDKMHDKPVPTEWDETEWSW